MRRFFAERVDADAARLTDADARHALTVLRMKTGDECAVIMEERLFSARLRVAGEGLLTDITGELPSPEPKTKITLYQGLPKGEKMEFIAQKCTEAGVCRVVPVEMSRCVVRLDARDAAKKTERWQRIALEAAKQACRTAVPGIETPISMNALLSRLPSHGLALTPWEDARGLSLVRAASQSAATDIAVVIGPEGGMTEQEVAAMRAAGATIVTLGSRIFRTETAALAAVVMALAARGEYE